MEGIFPRKTNHYLNHYIFMTSQPTVVINNKGINKTANWPFCKAHVNSKHWEHNVSRNKPHNNSDSWLTTSEYRVLYIIIGAFFVQLSITLLGIIRRHIIIMWVRKSAPAIYAYYGSNLPKRRWLIFTMGKSLFYAQPHFTTSFLHNVIIRRDGGYMNIQFLARELN